MSVFARLRRPGRPSSPPESSRSAGGRSAHRRPNSSSDSSRAWAGNFSANRRDVRRGLARGLLFLLFAGLFLGAAPETRAQTTVNLVSNTGQSNDRNWGLALYRSVAQEFMTGNNSAGYTLHNVDINVSNLGTIDSSNVTVTIRSTSRGGSIVGTLTNPAFPTSGNPQVLRFTAPGQGLALTANTTYFLRIDGANNAISVVTTNSDNEDSGSASGWSIGNNFNLCLRFGSCSWTSITNVPQFAINGIVNAASAQPEITIAPGTSPVTEGTAASFTLTASPAPTGSLPVSVTVTDATGADFIASTAEGGKTLPMTGATYAYSIDTTADGIDEPSGPVTVTVNAGTGYTVGTNASASVTVQDNDATTVTLTGPAGDRTEGGTKGLSLTLNRPLVSGETVTAPLTFGTGAGTATRGTDYTLACQSPRPAGVACTNLNSGSAQVVFTGPSAASVAITLTATTDSTTEAAGEEVDIGLGTITHTGLDGGVTQADSLANFDIDDPGVVTVSPTTVSVVEGSSVPGTYTVVLGSDPGASVTVTATSGNAAAAQVRRLGAGSWGSSVTLTFTGGNGGNWATPQTVAVRAPSDGNTASETVTVSHAAAVSSNTDNPFHGTDVADVTVSVADSNGLATVAFQARVTSVNENESSGNVVVTVTKTGNAAAAVAYATSDLTAEAGSDYTATSGTLTWGANDTTSRTITVPILNDTAAELSESFGVNLSLVPATPTVIGANDQVTVTIFDDDVGGVLTVPGFGSTANVDEGGTATFTLTMSQGNTRIIPLRLRVVTGGAGTAGTADASVEEFFDFPRYVTTATATVRILPDTLVEGAETLTVEVHSLPMGVTLADGDDGRDDIIINDVPSVNLSVSASGEVTEGGTLTITATRSTANSSGSALSIPIRVKAADTTAQAADYTLSATSISIPNNATTGTATVTAVDDSGDEPPETVTIEIGTPPAGTVKGPDGEVEIAIADGDPTVVSLARVGTGAVTEGNDIEFTVSIPRALVAGETIDVPLSIGGAPPAEWSLALKSGGSLNTGVTLSGESTATPQVRLSGAGAQTATLLLTATDDSTADDGETWTIALGPDGSGTNGFDRSSLGTDVGGGANPHGSRNSFNVQVDDPAVTPDIAVSESSLALTEGHATDSEKTYTVRLATDPGAGVTVTVTPTSTDTGAATVTPASLSFTGGGSGTWRNAGTFTVSAVADGDTTNESLSITHLATAPSGNAYRGITVAPVAVTVTDAGNGVIVSPTVLDVRENGGTATYTIRLASAPGGTVTVTPTSGDTTHATVSGPVSFTNADWSTAKDVTVTAAGEATDTARIAHAVTAGTTAYPTTTSVDPVNVTLTADPRPVVTIAPGTSPITEGTDATYTVTVNPAPSSGNTLTVALFSDIQRRSTFADPRDTGINQSVTVDDSGTATFTVRTVADNNDERNQTLAVGVIGRDHYQVGDASVAVVRVLDDDPTTVTLARDGTGAIAEASGTATVTVTLSRFLDGDDEVVTVPLTVTGTRITSGDYTLALATGSGVNTGVTLLTSAPHSPAEPAVVFTGHATDTVQVATLTLTALDDSDDEGTSETLTVGFDTASNRRVTSTLDRASGTGTGGTTTAGTAVVEITDNDADTTAPALSSAVVTGASLVLTYDEPLDTTSTPASGAYTVSVGGTNRSVSTVTVSGSTVTLALSSAVTSSQTVTLSYAVPNANPIQDAAGNDALALTGQAVTNNTAGVPVVSITLPNVEGVDRNAAGAQVRPEAQATATFNVSAAPAPTGSLTVCVRVTESDEPGAGDRVAAGVEGIRTVTLTGAAGEHAVAWTDDTTDERDSGVTVTAVAPETAGCTATNGSYTVSTTNADDSILIRDDDPTRVSLTSTDASMSEADATDTAVAVVTLGRRLYAGETLSVPVALSSSTGAGLPGATREDFTVTGTGTGAAPGGSGVNLGFTFTGHDTNTVRTATLTFTPSAVVDDDTTDDTVTATLGVDSVLGSEAGVGGGALRHATNYQVDLTHVDRALVSLSVSGSGNVTEGGTLTVTATRTKANTSGSSLAIPVRLRTADSTAVGADYTLAASISIPNNAATGTATFTAVDDNGDEPPETAVLEFGTLPAGTWAGTNGEVVITIADNDATTVTLAAADGDDVTEGGTKDFTITLNRGLVSGEILPVTLTFGTGSGTATRGTDYTLACASATGVACTGLNSGTATITFTGPSSGATAASVTLTLTAVAEDPNVVEAAGETVDIDLGTLTSTSGTGLGGGAAGTDNLADFDINDEDLTAPVLSTATVNGTSLVLTYNEALDEGSTPAAAAFTVTADGDARTVSGVAVDGTTVTLTLDTGAAHGETVLVSYALPGSNRIQDEAGNEAVALTSQAVDNNTPDTTAPVLSTATVTGASLVLTYNEALDTASTPATSAFTVTLAGTATTVSGVSVTGSTVTLTLSPAAAHDETVVVSYVVPNANRIQDTAGNDALAFANRSVANNTPDTTAPLLSTATVTGNSLVLTYNEALDTNSTPAVSAYTVTVAGTTRTVNDVAVNGQAVTLTLSSAVAPNEAVTVSYAAPGSNPVQDAAGNDAANLTNEPVTNNTADTTAPVLSTATVTGTSLVLTYDEALDATSRPAAGAFTVRVAGTTRAVSGVAMSGQTVTLTLSSAVAPNQAVRLSYAVPNANPIRDAAGNNAVALTNEAVTNNTQDTTAPALSSAKVTGTKLVLTYDEALDPGSTPANSAYTVTVGGNARAVNGVTISDQTVTLTLSSAPVPGDAVRVSYTVPNANPIQDAAGNAALAFADRQVSNDAVGVIGHVRLGTPSALNIGEGGSSQVSLGVYDDNGNVITGAGDVHVGLCFSGTALTRLANVRGRAADYKLQVWRSDAWRDQAAGRYHWTRGNPCPDDGSGRVETTRIVVKEGLMQLRVVALPDGREEIDETAIVTVGEATYLEAGVLKGLVEDRNPVTVTVGATTMSGPAASFAAVTSDAGEASGTHTVRVELAPAPTSAIAIGYGVSGTAREGLDYTALSGSVQVPANAAHADIQVALLDDNIDESDETVVLTLHAGDGYTVLGTGTHTLTLSDDDGPPPVVSITGGDPVTEGGQASFTLTADPEPAAPIQVKVNVVDSGDFALSGQTGARTFTIGTGGTKIFTVGTDDDNFDEPNGALTATVTAGTGYTPPRQRCVRMGGGQRQ